MMMADVDGGSEGGGRVGREDRDTAECAGGGRPDRGRKVREVK